MHDLKIFTVFRFKKSKEFKLKVDVLKLKSFIKIEGIVSRWKKLL